MSRNIKLRLSQTAKIRFPLSKNQQSDSIDAEIKSRESEDFKLQITKLHLMPVPDALSGQDGR
jgi:hypothetical protein